jgi:3-methyladenine DNA glycosylase AlkD
LVTVDAVVKRLKAMGDPRAAEGMSRFGIQTRTAVGVSVPMLRGLATRVGKDHRLAQELWNTGIHEARILASMVDIPEEVTEKQMEEWSKDFDSWDVVDGCCGNLFDRTRFAIRKATEWCRRPEEFVKRAGFVLMAELAVHDKKAPDNTFVRFFPFIVEGASDDRNFVKKAVNWALRQIGKRNAALNKAAIQTAKKISTSDSRSARWVAADALRELTGTPVQKRLRTLRKTCKA